VKYIKKDKIKNYNMYSSNVDSFLKKAMLLQARYDNPIYMEGDRRRILVPDQSEES
jgi:hypothetical protein